MISLVRFFLGFSLVLTSLFLILLVLVQRGRGGGLAGALGGMGGQSAFGTKAGDVFTRITVAVAAVWILLCILSINVLGRQRSLLSGELGGDAPQAVAPQTTPPAAGVSKPAAGGDAAAADEPLEIPAASPAPPAGGSSITPPPAPAAPATPAAAPAAPTPTR
jgi:preprotein translocase subunit SecG